MNTNISITINMDKTCAECGQKGAVPSGLCLSCTTKAMQNRAMRSEAGKLVAERFQKRFGKGDV